MDIFLMEFLLIMLFHKLWKKLKQNSKVIKIYIILVVVHINMRKIVNGLKLRNK